MTTGTVSITTRIGRFIDYPMSTKIDVIKNLLHDTINSINIFKVRKMKAGFLIYESPDIFGGMIKKGRFDEAETKLIKRLNLKDQTAYDIGAHHGYYSLLLSKSVGNRGRVFSFEPSGRERRYFRISQLLNMAVNTTLVPLGVSSHSGKSVFYQVRGEWTGLNSIRKPRDENYKFSTKKLIIKLTTLDAFTKVNKPPVFIKIDTEGAEFSIVRGARHLLMTAPPLILMEMEDKRSKIWNYKIRDMVKFLELYSYKVFKISEEGCLKRMRKQRVYEGNYFLVPKKSIGSIKHLIK